MKNLKRQIIFLYLCLGCCIWIGMPMTAFAASEYTEGDFHYQLEGESITITEYFGSDSEVTVPSVIAGYPVSKIAQGAFSGTTVKTLHLPDTIMTIENQAIGTGVSVIYENQKQQTGNQPETEEKPGAADGSTGNTDNTSNTDSADNTDPAENNSNGEGSANNKKNDNIAPDSSGGNANIDEAEVNLSDVLEAQVKEEKQNGIASADNSVITVDEKKRLISIDKENKVTVLDDSAAYRLEQQSDGSVRIFDSENREVTADKDGNVTVPALQKDERQSETGLLAGIAIIAVIAAGLTVFFVQRKRKR